MFDFERPSNNDWLAVNQFTVVEGDHKRRLDVVLFLNGLPLAVIELENPANEDATIRSVWQQLRTSQVELPSFFAFNAVLAISDVSRPGSAPSPPGGSGSSPGARSPAGSWLQYS